MALKWYSSTVILILSMGFGLLSLALHSVLLAALEIAVFGLANGALTLARTDLLASYSPGHFGAINGRLAQPVNLAQALTPFVVGLLFSWTRGYRVSLLLFTALANLSVWTLMARKTQDLKLEAAPDDLGKVPKGCQRRLGKRHRHR